MWLPPDTRKTPQAELFFAGEAVQAAIRRRFLHLLAASLPQFPKIRQAIRKFVLSSQVRRKQGWFDRENWLRHS